MKKSIQRGDIWLVDLNPVRGHEQAGVRPVVVISADVFNQGPSGLVIGIPLTSVNKRIRLHCLIKSDESGLPQDSYAKPEDIRSISYDRLFKKIGFVADISVLEEKLKILLSIF